MKIIKKYMMSMTGDLNDCEDKIVITDDFISVIDGVTSKRKKTWKGKTSGQIAAQAISQAIKSSDKSSVLLDIVKRTNKLLQKWYKENNITINSDIELRATASFVIYSVHYNELWFIGDCQALVNNVHYKNDVLIDQSISVARSIYLHTELAKGKKVKDLQLNDTGREFISPLLNRQHYFQNTELSTDYSYTIVDGFSNDLITAKKVELPNQNLTITLASDGYPELHEQFDRTEERLKEILDNDPLLIKEYKSTKGLMTGNASYDDRSFIKFQIQK